MSSCWLSALPRNRIPDLRFWSGPPETYQSPASEGALQSFLAASPIAWEARSIIPTASSQNKVVLDYYQVVAGLFQDGHELEYCEGSMDLYFLEAAAQLVKDGGVVAADVEDFVALQVKVAVGD